jgi:hypothetical protein
MGKGNRNRRNPDYYKVAGGAVEDRDRTRMAKDKVRAQRKRPKKARAARSVDLRRVKQAAAPPVTERQANERRRRPRGSRLFRLARGAWHMAETAVDMGRAVVAVVRARRE